MKKYKIKSQEMQNGKWQPAYLPPQGPIFSEPTEFDIYFDTKQESDNYTFDRLRQDGISANNIEK